MRRTYSIFVAAVSQQNSDDDFKHDTHQRDRHIILRCIVVWELQVMIGNAKYQCSCVHYVTYDNTPLIAGLTVTLVFLLIIVVIIICIVLYRRRKRKLAKEEQVPADKDEPSTKHDSKVKQLSGDYEKQEMEEQYKRQLPYDYVEDETPVKQQAVDDQYKRQLPDDDVEDETPVEQRAVDNQYQRQLPGDDVEDEDKIPMEQEVDNEYTRKLPDDYNEEEMPMELQEVDNHHNQQRPDKYNDESYA